MYIHNIGKPSKTVFMNEAEIAAALSLMSQNPSLDTKPCLMRDHDLAMRLVSFQEMHTAYLKEHPKVNPEHYLSNLRAMIKIRP